MLTRVLSGFFVSLFFLLGLAEAISYNSVVGKINPEQEDDFIRVAETYKRNKNNDSPLWMRSEGYFAFVKMAHAAKKAGISLEIVSAWRSYEEQIPLFVAYGIERALPPGTSSHHYGYAIDLAGVLTGSKTEKRLQDHASSFGFCQSYDGVSSGQGEERWHYEYAPGLSRKALATYRDQLYLELTKTKLIEPGALDKKTLFDTYVYPYNHRCIDAYPSRIDDFITGIRFERFLDSTTPEMLVYALGRYKSTFGKGLHDLLPKEIRFTKKGGTLQFAPLDLYPINLQNAFRYNEWFRVGMERLVLTRIQAKLMAYDERPVQ